MITEKENIILSQLDVGTHPVSQRAIAQRTGFSVGLVNAIIKKLVLTGYVKISNVNRRQMRYLLTPDGFMEKTRQSCAYVLRVTKQYYQIQTCVRNVLDQLEVEGYTNLFLQGEGKLRSLVETMVREELIKRKLVLVDQEPLGERTAVLNLFAEPTETGGKAIYFMNTLGEVLRNG